MCVAVTCVECDGSSADAKIKHQIKMGHPQIRLLYMTPETLLGAKIRYELDKAYEQGQLNRLVVDEVSNRTNLLSNSTDPRHMLSK